MKIVNILIALLGGMTIFCLYNESKILEDANNYKRELVKEQFKALKYAEILMDKHNLWDKDGSDEMAEYLECKTRIDSLINIEQ